MGPCVKIGVSAFRSSTEIGNNEHLDASSTPFNNNNEQPNSSSSNSNMPEATSSVLNGDNVISNELNSGKATDGSDGQNVETNNDAEKINANVDNESKSILQNLNIVVIGHVDSGKSTLMGHLLFQLGEVADNTFKKYLRESRKMGKSSFAYAWIMDEGTDERERGVTIDFCVKHFKTKNYKVTCLDAPGHYDFLPHLIEAAMQADIGILVVDAPSFDSNFHRGHIKQQVLLLRSLGFKYLIIVVNKMDLLHWDEDRYNEIEFALSSWLRSAAGFKYENLDFVPVSAFSGVNITRNNCTDLDKWKIYTDLTFSDPLKSRKTLLAAIDAVPKNVNDRLYCAPFCAVVSDVDFDSQSDTKSTVTARVYSGELRRGNTCLVMPDGKSARCTDIHKLCLKSSLDYTQSNSCVAGDYVESLQLTVNKDAIRVGSILCEKEHPLPVQRSFYVQLIVLRDVVRPITVKKELMAHMHCGTYEATIDTIEYMIDKKTGKRDDTNTQMRIVKALKCSDAAVVKVTFEEDMCAQYNDMEPKALSRIVFRDQGSLCAAGVIMSDIFKKKIL